MIVLLWLLWQFLDGRIGPAAGMNARRRLLNASRLPGAVWAWALTAGGFAMIAMAMIDTHSFQVGRGITSNSALAGGFAELPLATGITFMLVTSLLAAVVEESAFRGYMQSDLRQRFGIPSTTIMVALAFATFHVYGRTIAAWLDGFADWVAISVIFSILVYLTGSILPALVCHFAVDAALFSLDWFNDPLRCLRAAVPRCSISWGAAICILSAFLSALAFRQLTKVAASKLVTLRS